MINQGSNNQQSGLYHGYPYGSAYCGNINMHPSNQYSTFSGFAPNNSADQMHVQQHQVYPVTTAVPTIDPRFMQPWTVQQPFRNVMPYHQFVPYGQPAPLANPYMYGNSSLVHPYHFQNYQQIAQPVNQQPQIYNNTYRQAAPMQHNVPKPKLRSFLDKTKVVEEKTSGGNMACLEPPKKFPQPAQELSKKLDEVIWKPPFFEPDRLPGSSLTSSPVIEDYFETIPLSINTSDFSTQIEMKNVESPETSQNKEIISEQVKEDGTCQEREDEDDQESQDAISISSVENIVAPLSMSKRASCDARETLVETSSENSRAIDYSFPISADITSATRTAITLEPAPLVYSISPKTKKGSRQIKSLGLDEVSCSQASATSLTPRSLSMSTIWPNDSVDLTGNNLGYIAPPSLSPRRQVLEFSVSMSLETNSSVAGAPSPGVNVSLVGNVTTESKMPSLVDNASNGNKSVPGLISLNQNDLVTHPISKGAVLEREPAPLVSLPIFKETVFERESASSAKVVKLPKRILPANEDFSSSPIASVAVSSTVSTLSDSGFPEDKLLPLILESAKVDAPWQKVGARNTYKRQTPKKCTSPLPIEKTESQEHLQQEEQPPVKKKRKSRKKRRKKKNKKGPQEEISTPIEQAPPEPEQEMHNERRQSACSSLKEHLLGSFFINFWWKEKTY